MSNPSLILPQSPAFGEDFVYAAQVYDGEVPVYDVLPLTFTRASNGSRINKDGLVQNMPYNLITDSERIDVSPWAIYGTGTVTANATTAPNGTLTADRFVPSVANTSHVFEQSMGTTNGIITMSIYAKADGYDYICFNSYVGAFNYTWFNISNGTIGTVASGVTASIENVGNGWYRCIVSILGGATTYFSIITATANGITSFAGNGTSGIFVWGAQLNIGSTAQPYLATTDRLNMPRVTYPVGGGCGALLLEKQSTNLALYSEDFSNAAWTKTAITLTANATTSPDGTTNATSIIPTTANVNNHRVFETNSHSVATASYSIFVKPNGYNRVAFRESGTTGAAIGFDLLNQTIITTYSAGGCTASGGQIENMGNGWYRISGIFSFASATAQNLGLYIVSPSWTSGDPETVAWSGNGTDGVFLYGAQFEASSYPTSYIPTTTASATRIADACYKTGISSLIGQTEGTLFWQIQRNDTDNDSRLQISDGTTNNWLFVSIETGLNLRLYCNVGGVNQFSAYGPVQSNATHKIAAAYKNNDFKVYVDGVASITQTSGSVPTCSQLDIGNASPTGSVLSTSQIGEVILFKTRLTNAELATLTTL